MTDALPPLTRAERELLAVLMNASASEELVNVTSLQLRRLINELDHKDALLRKLAAQEPVFFQNEYPEGMVCAFCDADPQSQWVTFTHTADCPWAQARRETEGT